MGGMPGWRTFGKTGGLESQAARKVLKPKLWTLAERNLSRKESIKPLNFRSPPAHPPPPPPSHNQIPSAMASRRLALNLSQGLRSRAGLSAGLRRGLATPVSHNPIGKTQTTTLKNGLTVRGALEKCQLAKMGRPLDDSDFVTRRSPPSTPRGPRRRPSASGSMPARGPRRTRRTVPRTSSSTWPSRYAFNRNF